ncbi:acetylesterase [Arthrobacter psychrolactophilus]|uniref:Acetylesterase n=1 Tax=Arthrobacter psychrolactophilus TaxID=92442 RepID=A0A2V5IUJ7_9MICC|nr:acetylesterase [Arthrobacter psychrolactophilus]
MDSSARPSAIPGYEDWPGYVFKNDLVEVPQRSRQLAEVLGVPAPASNLQISRQWRETHDGVTTMALSWQLGFGPETRAWLVVPEGATGPLPGVLALHCHAGQKYTGASRLITFPDNQSEPGIETDPARHDLYDGRSAATDLARDGFAVLAHDTFSWGSRRFSLDTPPEVYNAAAAVHESTIAKAAGLIGTSFAGMVAHDDLAALSVLESLPEVDASRLGCFGFSGGGGRALMLAALSPKIRSYAITAMMTTFSSLLPAYLDAHSWLLQTPGLWKVADWPELTTHSSAEQFLIQFASRDPLFPEQGMRDADKLLNSLHDTGSYTGSFWPVEHRFSADMQRQVFDFFYKTLGNEITL